MYNKYIQIYDFCVVFIVKYGCSHDYNETEYEKHRLKLKSTLLIFQFAKTYHTTITKGNYNKLNSCRNLNFGSEIIF